jgi:hypothetical protein
MRTVRTCLLFSVLVPAATPCVAQTNFVSPASIISGAQVTGYDFGSGYPTQSITQVAAPIVLIFPVGHRLSVDVGSYYAYTQVRAANTGATESLSGFTDTQVRASYVIGRDAVVTSLMVNLPSGKKTDANSLLIGYAGNNFLLFPVNAYTNGTSVTGGVALAGTTGGWNLGVAGSVRYNADYEPFADTNNTYQPGLEGRVRVGADRLLGRSRFQVGFTFSTFGTDQAGGVAVSANQPGNRYIGEISLTAPVSSGSIAIYAWNFYRDQKGTVTPTAVAHENVFSSGVSGTFSLGRKVAFLPGLEARIWTPNDGMGNLFAALAGFRWSLLPHLSFSPGGKIGFGNIRAPGAAAASSLTGWQANGLLRYTF